MYVFKTNDGKVHKLQDVMRIRFLRKGVGRREAKILFYLTKQRGYSVGLSSKDYSDALTSASTHKFLSNNAYIDSWVDAEYNVLPNA